MEREIEMRQNLITGPPMNKKKPRMLIDELIEKSESPDDRGNFESVSLGSRRGSVIPTLVPNKNTYILIAIVSAQFNSVG